MSEDFSARVANQIRVILGWSQLITDVLREDPADDSPAGLERKDNALYAHPDLGDEPVSAAQIEPGSKIAAANDNLLAYANLLDHDRLTPYAHFAVVRASLEAAGQAAWLLDAPDSKARVARWCGGRISSMLEAAHAAHAVTGKPDKQTLARRERLIAATKAKNILTKKTPGYGTLVRDLVAPEPALANLAGLIYGVLSAVAHAENWGLRQLMEMAPPGSAPDFGPNTSNVGTMIAVVQSDGATAWMSTAVVLGHRQLLLRLARLYGRSDRTHEWAAEIDRLLEIVLPVLRQGASESP